MLTKDENKSLIAYARCTLLGSGKIHNDHNRHFDHDKFIPNRRSSMCLRQRDFSRELIREHLGRFIFVH